MERNLAKPGGADGWEKCAICKKPQESWLVYERFGHFIRVCRTCAGKWAYVEVPRVST